MHHPRGRKAMSEATGNVTQYTYFTTVADDSKNPVSSRPPALLYTALVCTLDKTNSNNAFHGNNH